MVSIDGWPHSGDVARVYRDSCDVSHDRTKLIMRNIGDALFLILDKIKQVKEADEKVIKQLQGMVHFCKFSL